MRILFVVDTLGEGGAERSLQEMLPVLTNYGAEPVVTCFRHHSRGVEALVAAGFELRVLESGNAITQGRQLRSLMREGHFDLIHTSLFRSDVIGRSAALGLGIPVMTSLVNIAYEPARIRHDKNINASKLAVVRTLEAVTGRIGATHFHAITHAVADAASGSLSIPHEKITVVYRGRDSHRLGRRTNDRRRTIRERLGLADEFVVLNVARQEFQKGQRHLIEAFRKAALPESKLLIAGRDGSASAELRVAANGAEGQVHFLGHRDDVPDLMVAADVFVLPSLWEGLGGVLLEAMALEVPVIAADIAPVREVFARSQGAVLVPAGDADSLAEALAGAWRVGGGAADRVARARQDFEDRFTIEKSGKAMFELFESVAKAYRG